MAHGVERAQQLAKLIAARDLRVGTQIARSNLRRQCVGLRQRLLDAADQSRSADHQRQQHCA